MNRRPGRLADVTAVGAHLVLQRDSPWITLSDGRGLSVQPDDIVVVQHRDATQMLPIADAAKYWAQVRCGFSDHKSDSSGSSSRSSGDRHQILGNVIRIKSLS